MLVKMRRAGIFFISLFILTFSLMDSTGLCESQNFGDSDYFYAKSSTKWLSINKKNSTGGLRNAIQWAVKDGAKEQIVFMMDRKKKEIEGNFYITDAKSGKQADAKGEFSRSGDNLLLTSNLKDLGLVFDVIFIPHPEFMEVVGKIKDITGEDRAIRVEYSLNLDAIGWNWWDDIRNVRKIKEGQWYANVTDIFVGATGKISPYPFSCVSSDKEAISYAIPLDRPRIFQINYDAEAKKYNIGFDFALSKKTEKFPSEATFFFIIYNSDPEWGFRAAAEKYYHIYPDFFIKRVEREGIWMPFTLINSVQDPQDFYFAFDEYGAVDIRYNNTHGIYSFLYTEPWTYWMAMDPNIPRNYTKAMELLKEGAKSDNAYTSKISQATLLSGMYDSAGEITHKFENAPWCNGAVFFDNSDPDIEHKDGLEYNRSDISFELARNEIVEKKISVFEGWESYDKGFEMDAKISHSGAMSLRVEKSNKDKGRSFGARQTVYLNQVEPKPFIFGGYSRALGVSGDRDADYSLYVDIVYSDNTFSWGHVADFNTGTHDWEYKQQFVFPEKPVKLAMFHILFRGNHTGTAWFDDIFLKELTQNEVGKIGKQVWDAYGDGFEIDLNASHSGKKSVFISKTGKGNTFGVRQKIEMNQEEASPILISGWSKTEDVAGGIDTDYSIYADITYSDDTPVYAITANFNTGTHDWQKAEVPFAPDKPIKTIMLHVLFRGNHTGKVWFEDISVVDTKTGKEYVADGSFEDLASKSEGAFGKDSPNLITNGSFEVGGSGLIVDGIYLDSLEGWAKEKNFRQEHFKYADIPLTFDLRTKEPVILNAFSIYEFTRAISDYMHQNNRLVMANWVVIDFPFYTPLLDVPGKEVNWQGWEGAYQPDKDELMNYRRTLSYQKPYLLLLNVHFDKFSLDMMEKYFQRSLFYGMLPSMFSFDAATDAYFENPKYYNRDRHLFIKYLPVIKKIAKAGWEPMTFARSSNEDIFIERYGKDYTEALYFTVHNNTDFSQKGTISIKKKENGLTKKLSINEVISNVDVDFTDKEEDITFSVSLDRYQTKVFRVIKDDLPSLSRVSIEDLDGISNILKKYEEQKKITSEESGQYGKSVTDLSNDVSAERFAMNIDEVDKKLSGLTAWAAGKGQPELLTQTFRAEHSISKLKASALKIKLIMKGLTTIVSPSKGVCEISLFNNGSKDVKLESILLTFSPDFKIEDVKQEIDRENIPAGGSLTKKITFTVPEGLKEGSEGAMTAKVSYAAGAKSFSLTESTLVNVVKDIDFKLVPVRVRTLTEKPEFKVFIRNNCNIPVKGILSVTVPAACQPSLKQEEVTIEANEDKQVTFNILCPIQEKRKDYDFKAGFAVDGKEKGLQGGIISVFPKSKSLLLEPGVIVKSDSDFPGYTSTPIYDGIIDTEGFVWYEMAWASAETASPHWVEMTFPKPVTISNIAIYWADDNGEYWSSEKYKVEYWKEGKWALLDEVKGPNSAQKLNKHSFQPVTADRIRVWQDACSGPKGRENLMWIKEIEVY